MALFQDRLTAVGAFVGLFVLVSGLGTLLGRPWQYAPGGVLLMGLQILGALAAVGIGLSLLTVDRWDSI
ncbi:MAG: hypothetical protein ABEJ60_00475 [Halodesulfurarchaeum sp.]